MTQYAVKQLSCAIGEKEKTRYKPRRRFGGVRFFYDCNHTCGIVHTPDVARRIDEPTEKQ